MNEQKSKADFTVKELDINDDILKVLQVASLSNVDKLQPHFFMFI